MGQSVGAVCNPIVRHSGHFSFENFRSMELVVIHQGLDSGGHTCRSTRPCSSTCPGSGWFDSTNPNGRRDASCCVIVHSSVFHQRLQRRLDSTLDEIRRLRPCPILRVDLIGNPRNFMQFRFGWIFPVAQHSNAPSREKTRKGDSSQDAVQRLLFHSLMLRIISLNEFNYSFISCCPSCVLFSFRVLCQVPARIAKVFALPTPKCSHFRYPDDGYFVRPTWKLYRKQGLCTFVNGGV